MATMDGLTMVATGMERDLLMLSQPQMLTLKLSHGMATMDGPTTVATSTERGLPTPSQLQLLMLMPRLSHGGTHTTDTHGHTMVMPITERGLLMLNQLLMLMPSLSLGGTAATDTVGHTTVTTGVKLAKNTPTGNLINAF